MNFSNELELCAPKPARTQSPKTLGASAFNNQTIINRKKKHRKKNDFKLERNKR